jgi:hypothetical protein
MRNTSIILSACLAILSAAPFAAHAQESGSASGNAGGDAFAKRLLATPSVEQKTYACFVRTYDKAHLAKHPRQKVTDMKLLVGAERLPEDAEVSYSFRVNVKLRTHKGELESFSSCGHAEASENPKDGMSIHCGGECGGGGLNISPATGDKAVMLNLDDIGVWPVSKPEEASDLRLDAGRDDKVFRLDRVSNDICAAMIAQDKKDDEKAKAATAEINEQNKKDGENAKAEVTPSN